MEKVIKKVLEKLVNNGYKAYVVGGYVRDNLLGISSIDVDICTSALQKDIHKIFNITNSNNYGGSNIKIKEFNIDITTFRKENKYVGRFPVEIEYIDNLSEDLLRRDFTINALCMDKTGKIIDELNGINDLNNCVIRSIGNSLEKIKEDPLRILRAIRFATILDFEIEENLFMQIKENGSLVTSLSKARIKEEISKILMSKNYLRGLRLLEVLGLKKELNMEYDEVIYCKDLLGMFAQVKIEGIPFTKEESNNIINITNVLKCGVINNFTLYKYGLYICTVAGEILNIKTSIISDTYKSLPIKDKDDIDIKGVNIIDVLNIVPGKVIKDIMNDLEKEILAKRVKNNYKDLKKYILLNKGKWLN
ncbi:MAG: hypothetical protein RR478_01275 [Bacilli bacterium]